MISPVFERLSDTAELSSIKFYKVDVDAQPDISQEVGVRAVRCCIHSEEIEVLNASQMPTFVAFKNGNKLKDLVGANPAGLQVRSSIV